MAQGGPPVNCLVDRTAPKGTEGRWQQRSQMDDRLPADAGNRIRLTGGLVAPQLVLRKFRVN